MSAENLKTRWSHCFHSLENDHSVSIDCKLKRFSLSFFLCLFADACHAAFTGVYQAESVSNYDYPPPANYFSNMGKTSSTHTGSGCCLKYLEILKKKKLKKLLLLGPVLLSHRGFQSF